MKIALVGLLFFAVALIGYSFGKSDKAKVTVLKAELVFSNGDVLKKDGEHWITLNKEDVLEAGDRVRTAKDARASFLLDDGSVFRLEGESEILLTELTSADIHLALESGSVYNRVVEDDDRVYQVEHAGTIAKALGTSFYVSGNEEETILYVVDSEVEFSNGDKKEKVEEGKKLAFSKEKQEFVEKELGEKSDFESWNEKEDSYLEESAEPVVNEKEDETPAEESVSTDVAPDKEIVEPTPEPTPAPKPVYEAPKGISAWMSGTKVVWKSSIALPKGVKVVWSKNSLPTYPTRSGDKYKYLSSSSLEGSQYLTAFAGTGTYYVRVCEYLGGSCGTYSNQTSVYLTAEKKEEYTKEEVSGGVNSIWLSGSGSNISWKTNGTSAKGFKVTWSKNASPTYPTRSGDKYHYFSSPNQSSDTLTAFSGDGTYYVRVCEYLGSGKCGVYSNQITVNLTK